VSNFSAYNFIKKALLDLKAQLIHNTITVGASIPLLLIGRSSRPKKKNQQRNLRIK
jgi:hypothetical protein